MKRILKISLALLALCWLGATVTRAQSPVVAGFAPVFEGGVGYTYMRSDVPSEGTLGMNGVLLSGSADFSRWLGVKLELGYSRNFDAFQTGHTADMLTYMGGPVFYPVWRRKFDIYTELLLGGARETGVTMDTSGGLVKGFVNHFAWAGGGGFQYRVTPALSVRVGADYLRSNFFNQNVVQTAQPNLRAEVSVVYRFGRHE